MIFPCILLVSALQLSMATIIIESGPVTNGVEMSGQSEQLTSVEAGDSKCQLITTAVTGALARKQHVGLLTEQQQSQALERFHACLGKLCNNSAMVDAFMQPQAFREQVDLLVVVSKLGDVLRGKESGEILLNLLVDGELKEILSEVSFPPKFTDDNVAAGLVPYMEVALKILERACNPLILTVGYLDMSTITEVLISSLNDRYTHNAISAAEVAKVWTMETMEEYHNLWNGIADKVVSPTSALTSTCLDPAVAYYNYEKISISRIRQIAIAAGMCVPTEEIMNIEPPRMESSVPDDIYDYYVMAAPPPPDYNDDGPPSDSGNSQESAPNMPSPSFNGPPV